MIDLSQEKKGVYLYLQKKYHAHELYSLRYTKIRQARIPNFDVVYAVLQKRTLLLPSAN